MRWTALPLLLQLRAVAAGSGAGEKHVLRWVDAASGLSSDLPHARAGASVARYTFGAYDLIYLFGGCGEVGCFEDLKRYDQKTNRWISPVVTGKPPTKRKGHTMVLLGDHTEQHLLVWGGWGGDGPVPGSLKAFDVAANTWEVPATAGTPPSARWAHTATAVDKDKMVVFGGEGLLPGQYYNDLYLFDSANEQWSPLHPKPDGTNGRTIPGPRMGHSACLIDQAIYVFGGYGQELRGRRLHRAARNDLWVLDLKGGLAGGLQWLYVETLGQAPTARGFHAAVPSSRGGNMFVLGGCDEVEAVCMNDIHMLDTEYPDGMRWRQLPVGMQRYEPRQQFAAWVNGGRILMQGGCTPALAAVGGEEHCFSDMWSLELGDLLIGSKGFNISANGTMVSSSELARDDANREVYGNNVLRNARAIAAASSTMQQPVRGEAGNGVAVITESAAPVKAVADANATSGNASAAGFDGALIDEADEGASMDQISAPSVPQTRPGLCTYVNLSRCERTVLTSKAGALATSIAVGDTSAFALGRFIRINPGGLNQEDAKIVGFGRRLTKREAELLELSAARDAAENAKEEEEEEPVSSSSRNGRRPGVFLQMRERSAPLLPQAVPRGRRAAADLNLLAADDKVKVHESVEGGAAVHAPAKLSLASAERVHGRALMRFLNLSIACKFAHAAGEPIIQLPDSTHKLAPAPGLQHLRPFANQVHRQEVEGVPPSPPLGQEEQRRAEASLLEKRRQAAAAAALAARPKMSPPPPRPPPHQRAEDDDAGEWEEVPKAASRAGALSSRLQGMQLLATVSDRLGYETYDAVPVWFWPVVGGSMAMLCGLSTWLLLRIRARRRQKRVQLEDVQAVFQTETWRKLE